MSKKPSAGGKIQWTKMFRKLSPYTIRKGFRYMKHYGPKEFWIRLHERFEPEEVPYGLWYRAYIPTEETLETQRKQKFDYSPLISIAVPAYQTPVEFLRQMIESLIVQTYSNWELCIVNASPDNEEMQKVLAEYSAGDSRVRFCNLKENLGIAENTNRAFAMTKGEFVGLLDHDDLLAPNALYEIVKILQDHPQADALYTDEDKVTTELDEHFQPHLKPDFNLDLLRSNNYICHFFVVRKSIVEKAGGFRKEFDGAQDYDFIFRCTENAGEVLHVPEILYHWRTHKASTADNPASKMYAFEAGKRAIEAHLERTGTKGEVSHTQDLGFYRVKYPVQGKPLVSVIIPNKDEKETLQTCLEMLEKNTGYQNFEIIIVENNSTTDEIFRYYKELSGNRKIHLLRWGKEFNYSAINNFAAAHAKGEYLLFLNNDVKSINPDWLEEMLGVCQRPEVGGVGAKLIYPDNTIQHAGCVIGMGGIAGHMFVDMPADRTGYLHKASLLQDMSAVTAACLLMKKEVFEQAGGFTEELAVAFNDVDLCLKVRKNGYLIVYDPYAKLYHMESKTRGAEDSKEKVRRFQTEIEYMRCHWIDILKNGDPCYNKNLSLTKWNYSLKPIPGMETEAGQKKREDREEIMQEVSVIIPNFNGMAYLDGVLAGLECQTVSNFDVILVDNGSNDGSCAFVAARYPWVHLIELPENFGFCKAVNEGIRASRSPYVLLLNNDIEVTENFIEEMLSAIKRHPKAFSCAARMIQFHDRDRLDDAGNYYCALGWAYARGKGKNIHTYEKEEKIFASCAGAAIYRKKIFDELGYFDEEHFAYLEDMDVGYRARIYGYENWYAPDAMVYHVGSGTSGSRYNQFKIRYSSRNNIYLIYKNMPVLQIIINLPFLVAGFGIKILFFTLKGFGREYIAGIKNGFQISKKNHKIPFKFQNLSNYFRIQVELWVNIFRRLCG